ALGPVRPSVPAAEGEDSDDRGGGVTPALGSPRTPCSHLAPEMTAAEFQAAGLYDPAAPDAPARLELLEWLAAQGVTLADMREAQRRWGALSGLAGDLALRAGERLT